jgi:hypothetical protein
MQRLALIGALLGGVAGACGVTDDDRPRTLEYITQTILAPTCAAAQCHSAFKQEVGDEFDTVDAARRTIVVNGLVAPGDPSGSYLYKSITTGVQSMFDSNNVRMPFDAPMPDADVALIRAWIQDGAPGAQCLANDQGNGCSVTGMGDTRQFHVVKCVDGNIGDVDMDCPLATMTKPASICSPITGNGQCTSQ